MRLDKAFLLGIVLTSFGANDGRSEIVLPKIIGDHMILQRGMDVLRLK